MNSEKKERHQHNRSAVIDLLLIFIASVCVFIAAAFWEAFEWLIEFSQKYENFELDEILTVLIIMPFAFFIYAYRRLLDLKKESGIRIKAEMLLKTSYFELRRTNRELHEFLNTASHDLQEPLRKIQVIGTRLKARSTDILGAEEQDQLQRMQNEAARMQTILNDLLIYSQIETKAQPFTPVDLNAVAREVLTELDTCIKQKSAHIEFGDLPTIEADTRQMKQLFQNLIDNTLKFHKKDKPPMVKVNDLSVNGTKNALTGHVPLNGRCQIIVEDDGIGFDEQYANRIFGVFQQLHGRNEYDGSGIGLSICKKIVERHNGSIDARSTPGHGAAFTVTLPVKQPTEEVQSG